MHLIQRYALSCGVPIGEPFILPKFYPLVVDKFITLHPNSKYPSKCYSFWQDVIDLIHPILTANDISIVQIGTKEDKPLRGCYYTAGQTTINQAAYIVSHAMIHVGADSFAAHI